MVTIAAFKDNGRLLGQFMNVEAAAQVLNVKIEHVRKCLESHRYYVTPKGQQSALGRLRFLEVDSRKSPSA